MSDLLRAALAGRYYLAREPLQMAREEWAATMRATGAKEPWQMTRAEWESALKAANAAESKMLQSYWSSPNQKQNSWGTQERIRLARELNQLRQDLADPEIEAIPRPRKARRLNQLRAEMESVLGAGP